DQVQLLEVRGTSRPKDLKKSLLEMSLTSELTKGIHGLYHAQINPAIGEDLQMTPEEWATAADILEKHLGFEGQKRAIVLHEKRGRIHGHIVWERYDHETERLRKDGKNYKKHDKARDEIEQILGHDHTPQREDQQPEREYNKSDYKRELSDLWQQFPDAKAFVQEAEKAGYQIAVTNSNRPWRVITPEGVDENLVRMLEDAKTADVRKQLQPIRNDLKTVADALEEHRARAVQKENERQAEPPQPDKTHELSDSQDLANAMLNRDKKEPALENEQFKGASYSINIEQKLDYSPALLPDLEQKPEPDRQLSDSQDKAAALRKKYLDRLAQREKMMRQALTNSREQTNTQQERGQEPEPAEPQYYDEIEGDEIEDEDLERDQDRDRGRDRGGYER
ncbi:relaxase/mobilization nuclease domain-containing protein, partial [Dyadobacter sp. CY323]|uniref:relaxase/mobilization nuclease domain-containing protein n=1 Tax=Dyadobacter sp. CY323 TaxID=2907302 RepID=UPI001F17D51F